MKYILIATLLILGSACGTKGQLYLPDDAEIKQEKKKDGSL